MFVFCTHMAEAAPHHLELIYQLLVQRTHFWVHQLLVHRQADSENVNLLEINKTSLNIFWCVESKRPGATIKSKCLH